MLPLTSAAVDALQGSLVRTRMTASVWVGDTPLGDVPLASWQISEDATRQVRTQVALSVVDDDGRLSPWESGDPLAPGAHVQLVCHCEDGTEVPVGRYVVTRARARDTWTWHGGTARWLPAAATVSVEADDLTRLAVRDRLLAPWATRPGRVVDEVVRLLDGVLPVVDDSGSPATVAGGVIVERDRFDGVEDLLAGAGLLLRMDGSGVGHIIEAAIGDPVWRVAGGRQGTLVNCDRTMDLDDVTNAVVATSSGVSDREYVARAYLTDGVERWDGPLGRAPQFYASPMITSDTAAWQAAQTRLRSIRDSRSASLDITCLPHPGLQCDDAVEVVVPSVGGGEAVVVGRVVSRVWSGAGEGPGTMQLRVMVPRAVLGRPVGDRR